MTMERIGDAERDQTTSALSEHYAAGRLTYEEFDQRVGMATHARTQMELDLLLGDLPSVDKPSSPTVPNRRRDRRGDDPLVVGTAHKRWMQSILVPTAVSLPVLWWLWQIGAQIVAIPFLAIALILLTIMTGVVTWIRPQVIASSPKPKELPER